MDIVTKEQAARFLLVKHGLLGEHRFCGKSGALEFVRQAGCIQFDPVDVCGKNAELTLRSRVKDFTKGTLYELLYQDRKLVDYPDKNLSILPLEDWPYFERYREAARACGRQFPGLAELEEQAKDHIRKNGPVSSEELPIAGRIHWHSAIHWSGNWGGETNAARAVLEQLYSAGELVIHRKNGARKFYDLAERHIPPEILAADDPLPDDAAHRKWRVLRRIGAVGLLWDRPSDAWLNIDGLKSPQRAEIFADLQRESRIAKVQVQGLRYALYYKAEDRPLWETALQKEAPKPRCELLAPLDCMLWDRNLIRALFDFDYTWEIYTPQSKRKFGYYTLPLLFGQRLAGRVAARSDRKAGALVVKNVWYESGTEQTGALGQAIEECLQRFALFNECDTVCWEKE